MEIPEIEESFMLEMARPNRAQLDENTKVKTEIRKYKCPSCSKFVQTMVINPFWNVRGCCIQCFNRTAKMIEEIYYIRSHAPADVYCRGNSRWRWLFTCLWRELRKAFKIVRKKRHAGWRDDAERNQYFENELRLKNLEKELGEPVE